jgi:formylglycine-generating enzyme required for sulfatase activity
VFCGEPAMRLFISYARVDKYFCTQIVDLLDVHDVWYDHRLHAGQQWWDEILKELEWCEGLVYLLSPDSVNSEYCQRELSIAQSLGKHVFPVLIQARTPMPDALKHIQYADLSGGLTTEGVKGLLNSIYIAERQGSRPATVVQVPVPASPVFVEAAKPDASQVIYEAADAMQNGQYDRAVFLLKQVKANGFESRFIDLSAMIHEAEHALEWQAYLREAEREYTPIAALIKRERTRKLGVQAFRAFQKNFPDYDPENLAGFCTTASEVGLLDWCDIPAGVVTLTHSGDTHPTHVDAFRLGKFPVTNAQYQEFIDAPDGYCNSAWWDFSPHARRWFLEHPEPLPVKLIGHNHPCVNVCWYEAMAYCAWLSNQTGLRITLPTEHQWQRAAQGDDGRLYPWGDTFEVNRCNSKEGSNRMTVPVNQYPTGVSPYGVFDMAGNTWEWCLDAEAGSDPHAECHRIMRGGSYISPHNRVQCGFSFSLNPQCRYETIGFRLACLLS